MTQNRKFLTIAVVLAACALTAQNGKVLHPW